MAELARLLASVHPNLFHAFIEDPHAAAIPADPDFAADQFRWRFVKGSFDFHVAVAMNAAPAFLEAGKKRSRERLQVRAFLFKAGSHLFARRAMDARVGDAAFPVTKEEVFLGQGLEATALERIGANQLEILPVVSRADKLEGIVTLRDVLDAYGVSRD